MSREPPSPPPPPPLARSLRASRRRFLATARKRRRGGNSREQESGRPHASSLSCEGFKLRRRDYLVLWHFVAVFDPPREVSLDSVPVLFLPGGSPLKFGAPFPGLLCARGCVTSCSSPIGRRPGRFFSGSGTRGVLEDEMWVAEKRRHTEHART